MVRWPPSSGWWCTGRCPRKRRPAVGLLDLQGGDTMTLTRRSFLAGGAAAAAVTSAGIVAARAQGLTKLKFTLPWIPHGGYTHMFVAKKLGFFEKRGLDVTIDRGFGSGEVCKTLGLGQYEFGSLDLGVMTNCAGKSL